MGSDPFVAAALTGSPSLFGTLAATSQQWTDMRLGIRFDIENARVWHAELIRTIEARLGVRVGIEAARQERSSVHSDRLLRFESRLRGRRSLGLAEHVPPSNFAQYLEPAQKPDVLLALDATGSAPTAGIVWQLFVDGQPGEAGLLPSILAGRAPIVEIRDGSRVLAGGRLGTESRHLQIETVNHVLARVSTLVSAALAGNGPPTPSSGALPSKLGDGPLSFMRIATTMAALRLRQRLTRALYRTPHWRVGWRKLTGPDLFALRSHPSEGWRDLPDDGHRFYADPFPIVIGDTLTLFVEDYPHATGKGVISAVRFGDDGPEGVPEAVLALPYHLSYPFVFERDGDVWMIPESCAAGRIDLFRATRFPGGWVKEATLVDEVAASDATLVEADGLWWLFATVADGGAFSDALHLWSAPDFRGPWMPHRRNPVLVDIAGARPAGRMVWRDGALLRPVQDCRQGYGAALGFAQVRQLDATGFIQEIDSVLSPGRLWPGSCLHTVNAAGGFEFIDGSGRALKAMPRLRSAVNARPAVDAG